MMATLLGNMGRGCIGFRGDRKSVVKGKSVDLGGRRIIKKKNKSANDKQIIQSLVNSFTGGTYTTGNFKAPVFFNGYVYFSADSDNIKFFVFSSRRRHTRFDCDWSSDVCSSDLGSSPRTTRPIIVRSRPTRSRK